MHFPVTQRRRRRICLALALNELQNNNVRWMWVHPIYHNREEHGEYFTLYREYRQYDEKFFGWYRMTVEKFDDLLEMVEPQLRRQGCYFHEPVCAEEMLVITIP